MLFKSNRPARERGILISIILGILGHVVSAMFFYSQITPDYEYFESPAQLKTVQLYTIYTQEALEKLYINFELIFANSVSFAGANYKKFLPPHPYINLLEHKPSKLADLLIGISQNPREYQRYDSGKSCRRWGNKHLSTHSIIL